MRRTELFTKTTKNLPADETARNAQLLIQAGYVHKEMTGVYSYSPLGIALIENIKQIVREEMNVLGGQELIMSSLQPKETWEKTGRWDDGAVDIWFKSKLKNGTAVGLAWSHEEAIIQMMKNHISSYKDLPVYVYQFQAKLRNELRSKSGIMRGREFVMKDMYSCTLNADQHEAFYQKCIESYHKVFDRLGIGEDTFLTVASGGAFTEFSHEFQTICDAGEDTVYLSRDKKIAINKEVLNEEVLAKHGISRDELEEIKTAEVGNIFDFNVIKSKETDFKYNDQAGNAQFVHLGSYGIGVTRLAGVLAEKFADNKGLVWPEDVAPAKVYLASVGDTSQVTSKSDEIYKKLEDLNIKTLFDDRNARPGEKFADADLIGLPYRVVVSEKSIEKGGVELKPRISDDTEIVSIEDLYKRLAR